MQLQCAAQNSFIEKQANQKVKNQNVKGNRNRELENPRIEWRRFSHFLCSCQYYKNLLSWLIHLQVASNVGFPRNHCKNLNTFIPLFPSPAGYFGAKSNSHFFHNPTPSHLDTTEMALPKVNEMLLENLEEMGFPRSRAMRALYYSGNISLEDAINWIVEHENDADIDELPSVDVDIEIESSESFPISEEIKIRAQQLRDQNRKRKEEEEKQLEREREKERIQAGKNLIEAKRIAEENERKRNLALRKAEKEEEKRAREKVLRKLDQDKLNRRSKLGYPQESHAAVNSSAIQIEEERNSKPVYMVAKTDHLSDCLRSLKRNHKGEDARVRRAFQTLLIYVGNVVKNPNEEKYRKIRLSNPLFQDRVGSLNGGVEFLELCGFERIGDFLYLPHEKVDMAVLKSAVSALNTAMTNPFFGLLST